MIGNLDEMSAVAVASEQFRSMVQVIPGDASKSLGCDAHRPWIRGLSSCAALFRVPPVLRHSRPLPGWVDLH
jgi:hypothetical protein